MRFREYLVEARKEVHGYDRPRVVPKKVKLLSPVGDWEKVGEGCFAVVYDNPDSGGATVVKQSLAYSGVTIMKDGTPVSDAYLKFILGIQNRPALSDNPYLPQVFRIEFDILHTSENYFKAHYEIEMEKLHDLDFLSKYEDIQSFMDDVENTSTLAAQLYHTLLRVFDDEMVKSLLEQCWNGSGNPMYWFGHVMKKGFKDSRYIRDKRLADAMDYIRAVEGSFDMHYRNVMYRATPYGMQLVITDPLS